MKHRSRATWVFMTPLIFALLLPSSALHGQTAASGSTADDAAKRLQWLKSRGLAPAATPAPKKRFAAPRIQALRPMEAHPAESSEVKKTPVEKPVAAAASPATPAPEVRTAKEGTAKTVTSKTATAGVSEAKYKVTPAEETSKKTAQAPAAKEASGKASTTKTTAAKKGAPTEKTIEKRSASAKPVAPQATPAAKIANSTRTQKTSTASVRPAATPAARKETSPPTRSTKTLATASRPPEIASGPKLSLKTPATSVALAASSASRLKVPETQPAESRSANVSTRYPWKTNIVTTVFWVGEAPSGNNFTPNYASSWDRNWTRSYGGYDNPDPDRRRNYIPVKFTPRQNPFYIALPYNDVTRGTTKPESRRVIPWFKTAFQREGLSVCHNRWVAVRSRSGKVAYAQWSDCGPFRTDHWQYVFGKERPKPNLNKGAGLDVSPAVRDYLGLAGTDVTDWKFVEASEVPRGPWALHGENNTAMNRGTRMAKKTTKRSGRSETKLAAVR